MKLAHWSFKILLIFVTLLISSMLTFQEDETFLDSPDYQPPDRETPGQTKDGGTRSSRFSEAVVG